MRVRGGGRESLKLLGRFEGFVGVGCIQWNCAGRVLLLRDYDVRVCIKLEPVMLSFYMNYLLVDYFLVVEYHDTS